MIGRPTTFNQDIADRICARLIEGESLREMCLDEDMPGRRTVLTWLSKHDDFQRQYTRARELQADAIFDDVLDIADDGRNDWIEKRNKDGEIIGYIENGESARRSALRVDARKWMLGKLAPKKYGDKMQPEEAPVQTVVIRDETSR